jgi:hypothetical protein
MMLTLDSIWQLPLQPAVYVLHGVGASLDDPPVFVGMAENLRRRATEQLVIEQGRLAPSSSLAMRAGWLSQLRWWEHPSFEDRHVLRAAELVASEHLDPLLRSRVDITGPARRIYEEDESHARLLTIFQAPPTGTLHLPTLSELTKRINNIDHHLQLLVQNLDRNEAANSQRRNPPDI